MNIGFWSCIMSAPLFAIFAVIFTIKKGKAANLIAGFNALPGREQEMYDKDRLVLDMRNDFIIWTVIMVLGAVCAFLTTDYIAIAAYGLWLVLLFKDMHMDARKAYKKYLKKES